MSSCYHYTNPETILENSHIPCQFHCIKPPESHSSLSGLMVESSFYVLFYRTQKKRMTQKLQELTFGDLTLARSICEWHNFTFFSKKGLVWPVSKLLQGIQRLSRKTTKKRQMKTKQENKQQFDRMLLQWVQNRIEKNELS